jgi:hypothetical protein
MDAFLPLLWLVTFCGALALVGAAATKASAARTPKTLHPPTVLWKSFPLDQARPRPSAETAAAPSRRQASPRIVTNVSRFPTVLFTIGLLATLLASTGLVLARRSAPARAGTHPRGRRPADAPRSRPVRRGPVSAPPDAQASDELLEALRPKVAQPEPALMPEPQLRPIEAERPSVSPLPLSTDPVSALSERREAQRCEIKLWRGYVKCQLYVAAAGSADAQITSRFFRLRKEEEPGDDALQALSTLIAELESAGWSVAATGQAWYDRRLERAIPD